MQAPIPDHHSKGEGHTGRSPGCTGEVLCKVSGRSHLKTALTCTLGRRRATHRHHRRRGRSCRATASTIPAGGQRGAGRVRGGGGGGVPRDRVGGRRECGSSLPAREDHIFGGAPAEGCTAPPRQRTACGGKAADALCYMWLEGFKVAGADRPRSGARAALAPLCEGRATGAARRGAPHHPAGTDDEGRVWPLHYHAHQRPPTPPPRPLSHSRDHPDQGADPGGAACQALPRLCTKRGVPSPTTRPRTFGAPLRWDLASRRPPSHCCPASSSSPAQRGRRQRTKRLISLPAAAPVAPSGWRVVPGLDASTHTHAQGRVCVLGPATCVF